MERRKIRTTQKETGVFVLGCVLVCDWQPEGRCKGKVGWSRPPPQLWEGSIYEPAKSGCTGSNDQVVGSVGGLSFLFVLMCFPNTDL